MTEPEDKTYRVSFLRGDDYTTIRLSPSGIKGEGESALVSFIHLRNPKVQAPFYLYRGRSHGQLLVNFESIRRMILRDVAGGETDTVTVHTERKIKRNRGNGRVQIVTEREDNTYRLSFLRGDDYTTIRPLLSGI